jgi:hypothetical protein
MVAGGLGPWATALGEVEVRGTAGEGWLTVGAGALAALLALAVALRVGRRHWKLVLATACGALGAGITLYDLLDIRSLAGDIPDGRLSAGWGIWVALLGSAAVIAAGMRALSRA